MGADRAISVEAVTPYDRRIRYAVGDRDEVRPDDERPWLEFCRRHDEVDLLVPPAD
jgi:hypothetical protein